MITKPKDECRPHAPPCNKAAFRARCLVSNPDILGDTRPNSVAAR